jgi:hypothetical protein
MTSELQNLSVVDLYLDPATQVPLSLRFSAHPDNDLFQSFPVEIRFEGYQQAGGILVPARIQKFLQNTLALDLAITSSLANSGVSPSLFATAEHATGGIQ